MYLESRLEKTKHEAFIISLSLSLSLSRSQSAPWYTPTNKEKLI
jgi:hypothetical protein